MAFLIKQYIYGLKLHGLSHQEKKLHGPYQIALKKKKRKLTNVMKGKSSMPDVTVMLG